MFSISVDFLHSTFRGDPEGLAVTGQQAEGEWPPSPARLFAAFVAADGTGDNCRFTDGSELRWLESLPAPVIHADRHVRHESMRDRYVVEQRDHAVKNTVHEYIGRSATLVRPSIRVTLREPQVVYQWEEVDPPDEETLSALETRAARIGYLGCADSPAHVRVSADAPKAIPADRYVPDEKGHEWISITAAGDLDILDRMHAEWCKHGADVSRAHFPALRHDTRYRSPWSPHQEDCGEVVAWLSMETPVSGRRILTVTSLFKAAILSKYQELHGEPPPVLHGHGYDEQGYELARYLALPDVGFRYSRGSIYGLALWVPPGTDPDVSRKARDAALSIRRLRGKGLHTAITPRATKDKVFARNPRRWCTPSKRWISAIPAKHERWGNPDLEEIKRWCQHAGYPAPVAFRLVRTPLVPGALNLAPVEVYRPGEPTRYYSHLEIQFAEEVDGPVVLGRGRQLGFGLCVQGEEEENKEEKNDEQTD